MYLLGYAYNFLTKLIFVFYFPNTLYIFWLNELLMSKQCVEILSDTHSYSETTITTFVEFVQVQLALASVSCQFLTGKYAVNYYPFSFVSMNEVLLSVHWRLSSSRQLQRWSSRRCHHSACWPANNRRYRRRLIRLEEQRSRQYSALRTSVRDTEEAVFSGIISTSILKRVTQDNSVVELIS